MIRIEDLSKSFGSLKVLSHVSAEIHQGDCVAVIGPSGTGKSVFLSCMNGLLAPDSGKVFIKGKDITDRNTDINEVRRMMGMVYQDFNLFSHLTVLENITLAPRKIQKLSREAAVDKAMKLLEQVSLVEKADAYPDQLSGGQQQRIAIARAMAMEPELVLFDEPTSALDPTMVGEVLAVIRAFARQGITMVIVTHEMEFAREVSNRVFFMEDHGIYEQGTPDEIFTAPKREKTIAFIEKLKTFRYTVASKDFDFLAFRSGVELFCLKYRVAPKTLYEINLTMEEIIFYILRNGVSEGLSLELSYSDKYKLAELSFAYGGRENNIFETDAGDLGLMMAKAKIRELQYRYDPDREHGNLLRIKL